MSVRLWSTRHHVRSKVLGYHARTDRKLVTEAVKKNSFFQVLIFKVLLQISNFYCKAYADYCYKYYCSLHPLCFDRCCHCSCNHCCRKLGKKTSPTLHRKKRNVTNTSQELAHRTFYSVQTLTAQRKWCKETGFNCSHGSQCNRFIISGVNIFDYHPKIPQTFLII